MDDRQKYTTRARSKFEEARREGSLNYARKPVTLLGGSVNNTQAAVNPRDKIDLLSGLYRDYRPVRTNKLGSLRVNFCARVLRPPR